MSATGRSDCRHPDDFYATPAWCTRAILRRLPRPAPGSLVLDPACGGGAILDVVREVWPDVVTCGIELDPGRAYAAKLRGHDVVTADALSESWSRYWTLPISVVVQNPPFSLGMAFVERAKRFAPLATSLHRQGFLASAERAPFWRATPAKLHFLSRRPSFAASVKCGKPKAPGCGWAQVFDVDAALPTACPGCGRSDLSVCRSDAADYAWFTFGNGVTREWEMLECEP